MLENWIGSRPLQQRSGAGFLDPALVTSCFLEKSQEKEKFIFKPVFILMSWRYCHLMMSGLNLIYRSP